MQKKLSDLFSNWDQLNTAANEWQNRTLAEAFQQDTNRAARFSVTAAGLQLDYSKNHVDENTLSQLVAAAEQADLSGAIKRLMRGDHVNNTEDRPALHSALRYLGEASTEEEKAVAATLEKMAGLIDSVHSGEWKGYTGEKITDVVNIGIGGSDLGPRMVTKALTPFHTGHVNVHFVANVDGAEIYDLTRKLNPASTLFLVASKSFSTLETLENSLTARKWMLDSGCAQDQLKHHFVAISSKVDKAVEFGIDAENVYPLWDWVGGRYSLWSAIGMPIAFAVGMENFNKLRAGAGAMDQHFATAPLDKNIPVLMGLLMFWYSNFLGTDTQAILPYAYHLQLLPAYLQQLEMESNGKSVTRDGVKVDYQTGSIVWGTEGTNGQHSFHQLLHQGTTMVPIDFIATLQAHHPIAHQHKYLFANCVAQSQALMTGRDLATTEAELRAAGVSEEEIASLAPHKVHPGNRPSNVILMEKLTPETLGALIAAYEHKVYTLGVLWNINSYDQWGVELGKLLGTHIANAITTTDIPGDWDSSTQTLVRKFNEANKSL
ncbi:glucose-6-phosphate isomerase [Teredinibacter turnerae T7901]|uniref:Glucose-6-phosphate isomerase n=1 Tax=Teredinibacter turnerae (strain ATCC 39867 / T7901) TaxID=377629 RepID=C5BQA9_TERTT|nr:glucose-6-phosphate isomerase [Teredinibacter turnerae]ACR13466.1 glucose-6-phosphate isomerase [Teredinibacter turnerae T7901]